MLQLYNLNKEKIEGLNKYKDLKIESTLSTGDKVLSFSYPKKCSNNIIEEAYIRTKEAEFVIKQVDKSLESFVNVTCNLNVEELENMIEDFNSTEQTIEKCINFALVGTGWTVKVDSSITKRRTVRKTNSSIWDIIQQAKKAYRVEIEFDTINKIVLVKEKIGGEKGVYFTDELNLKTLSIQSNSYDFYTRILGIGKDDLKVEVENYNYSNKRKTLIWKDERYTDETSLREDAILKLNEISKPYRSYSADIIDLAKLNEKYKDILSYKLGDTITLISKDNRIREKQRIVKIVEYPDNPSQNTVEIANTTLSFEDVQKEFQETTNTVNNITTDNGTVDGSAIDGISTEQIYDFEATIAKITNLEVINAHIKNLYAEKATIQELNAVIANVGELNATKANITDLTAINTKIVNLQADKANITDLTATNIKFNVGSGGTLDLQTLLAKHITGENGQFLNITSSNTVIANAVIKDAMIENVSLKKLLAGTISTNKFTISSDDGGIQIVGPTMQFKDKNNKVRIQMGQDATGNFNFILRGEDGTTTLIDHTGIKEKAIADDLIKSNMVASDAIGEKQINYSSLITGLNKDTNTQLIKASKVAIDLTGQSLEVSFNSLKTNVDNIEVGGRNLLKGKPNNSVKIENSKSGYGIKFSIGDNGTSWRGWSNLILERNKNYIVSFTAWSTKNISINCDLFPDDLPEKVFTITNAAQRFTFNIKSSSSNMSKCNLRFFKGGYIFAEDVYITDIKLEEGTKATDFTIAPEDVDSKIEANTTSINIAQGKIEGLISENSIIKGDITTISDKYTSLKATVDGINTTVASHTSSITDIKNNKEDKNNRVIYARGTGNDYNAGRTLKVGNNVIYENSYGRGARVTALVPTTLAVYSDNTYDLHSGGDNETNFINKINELNNGDYIIIVTSQDNAYLHYSKRAEVLYKIGGFAPKSEVVGFREAYALIGRSKLGKGNGVEMYIPRTADDKRFAEVSVKVSDNGTFIGVNSPNLGNTIDTVNTKITTVENKYTSLEQNLDGFKTTVSNTYSTKTELSGVDGKVTSLTSRVSTNESSITQLNNKIALKVESTEVNTIVNNAINNVEIGGRNLFLNSGFEGKITCWNTDKCTGFKAIEDESSKSGYIATFSSTGSGIYQRNGGKSDVKIPYEKGTKLIVSGYFKCTSTASLRVGLEGVNIVEFRPTAKDTWTYFELETIADGLAYTYVFYGVNGNQYWLKELKLEEGTKATDWTPAPEDIESSISTVSNKVATIETNLNSITSRVSDTETSITTVNGKVTDLTSRMSAAEQKITSDAIVSTVTSSSKWTTLNSTATNALNTANGKEDKNNRVIYARGTGNDYNAGRTLKVGNTVIYENSYGRGARVTALVPSTLATYFDGTYDLHSGGEHETNFVNKINELNEGDYIIIVTSQDNAYLHWAKRSEALYKIGGFAPNTNSNGYREAYALIGRSKLGKGNGVEMYIPRTADDKRFAEVSVKVSDNGTFMGVNSPNIGNIVTDLTTRIQTAEQKITSDAIVSTVTSSTTYKNDLNGKASTTSVQSLEQKITATAITTTISSAISGGTASITTTKFTMDTNGLTIKNGALELQDSTGRVVLKGTTNGDLLLRGNCIKIKDDLVTSSGAGMTLTRRGLSFTNINGGSVSFFMFDDEECLYISNSDVQNKRALYISGKAYISNLESAIMTCNLITGTSISIKEGINCGTGASFGKTIYTRGIDNQGYNINLNGGMIYNGTISSSGYEIRTGGGALNAGSGSLTCGGATINGSTSCRSIDTNGYSIEAGTIYSNDKYVVVSNGSSTSQYVNGIAVLDGSSSKYLQVQTRNGGLYGVNLWNSDINLKENIELIETSKIKLLEENNKKIGLEAVLAIDHYKFDYKDKNLSHVDCGYIAQQLIEVNKNFAYNVKQEDGTDMYCPDISALIPTLSLAIKEQQEYIKALEERIKLLESA